ncbi:MAG: Re/Si-specific NAD(P)(+) transhydrogenase subunit alpha [Acetobacterales bacterium]
MKLAIAKERRPHERRCAASPDTVRKLVALGIEVTVETGAGEGASIPDQQFADAGATLVDGPEATLKDADVVLKVQRPLRGGDGQPDELSMIRDGAVLVGLLAPHTDRDLIDAYAGKRIDAFALEYLPRISRAQSMDALSSQSNLTGYKAVVEAAAEFGRGFPMMMTAAGTVPPARVLVLGAGVAGLQAIATARRLGAIVNATDVRAAAGEEVRSLGATFLDVDPEASKAAQTSGGYAKEMGDDYRQKQAALVRETLRKSDVAICTALIPGRPAPKLISAEMVREMKPGSIIVDLAADQGGNCELSTPGEATVVENGVKILAYCNWPSRLATDTTAMYAKNLLNFLNQYWDKEAGKLALNWEDDIVKGMALTREGKVVHPNLVPAEAAPQPAPAPQPSPDAETQTEPKS